MSIPDTHRRKGMKDTDLAKEELTKERASGVHCNIKKDPLCSK